MREQTKAHLLHPPFQFIDFMIDFNNNNDLKFACDFITERLASIHQRYGSQVVIQLEELNGILIAEGLFGPGPSIAGITPFAWRENRALLSLIRRVEQLDKAQEWLPNLSFDPSGRPFFTYPAAITLQTTPLSATAPSTSTSFESVNSTATHISSGSRKAFFLKRMKKAVNRVYYGRTEDNFDNLLNTFEDMLDFLHGLPEVNDTPETGLTNAQQLEEIKAVVDSWPLRKTHDLPSSVQERRRTHRRFVEPWTQQEDELLEMAFEITQDKSKLSRIFGRSEASIEYKLEQLNPPV